MKSFFLSFLACASLAGAQASSSTETELTVPAVKVQPVAGNAVAGNGLTATPIKSLVSELARSVRVQPVRPEIRLAPGYQTGTLTFTLLSDVNTKVTLKSDDPRLVLRETAENPLSLSAYNLFSVNALALAPHSGTISVMNTAGEVIARVPYVVAPAKTVNQGINLGYSPFTGNAAASYSLSGVNQSPLDPSWNVSVNLSVNTGTGKVGGGVSLGVNW